MFRPDRPVHALVGVMCVVVQLGCSPDPVAPDTSAPGGSGITSVSVSVEQKFGVDANGNGVVDLKEGAAYARAPLQTRIQAKDLAESYPDSWPSDGSFGGHPGPWRWEFRPESPGSVPDGISALPLPPALVAGLVPINDGSRLVAYSPTPSIALALFEGRWVVELTSVSSTGTPIYWKSRVIQLEDVLIAQLGDSYSSGEGAPDRTAAGGYWGDDGTPGAGNGGHLAAHRSSLSWGSLAAQDAQTLTSIAGVISREFAGTVTFLHLAKSGARIDEVKQQVSALRALIGERKVDHLYLSVGGNDAGFSAAIAAYLLREPILGGVGLLGPDLDDIHDAIRTGNWTGGSFDDVGSVLLEMIDFAVPYDWKDVRGTNGLAGGYAELAATLQDNDIDPQAVLMLLYPDPFIGSWTDADAVCPGPVLTAVSSVLGRQLEIGTGEQRRAKSDLMQPLNDAIASAAQAHGWRTLDARKSMYGHAICADANWIVRHNQSDNIQGDRRGTLHPNAAGHRAIAGLVW